MQSKGAVCARHDVNCQYHLTVDLHLFYPKNGLRNSDIANHTTRIIHRESSIANHIDQSVTLPHRGLWNSHEDPRISI